MMTQFKWQNSSISNNSVKHKYTVYIYLTHRYDPIISSPEERGAMAIEGFSAFSKAPALLQAFHQIV